MEKLGMPVHDPRVFILPQSVGEKTLTTFIVHGTDTEEPDSGGVNTCRIKDPYIITEAQLLQVSLSYPPLSQARLTHRVRRDLGSRVYKQPLREFEAGIDGPRKRIAEADMFWSTWKSSKSLQIRQRHDCVQKSTIDEYARDFYQGVPYRKIREAKGPMANHRNIRAF
ncbi:hypothetical protein BDV96DRAFT_604738 [Lophiotrema nucula]|uniref:Uncharacterized protein n=1 Tax=Lophiotrema nucula TaxID=690887 RepID=A0A6A5YTC5_9PLEO|nr:hypothetical protein BDV96DRAFT_604738 [Lophiotrema nucula]